ncbi:AraC family transcriptional regulator [Olivibacter sp. SDN3]|uniref:helix-turn-helix domain-containing protein n=1 Tax=Olivibacter sp. SDN3 TaxID=2764720 RepID=UPI0016512A63|nr:helix-turn-helix domain-containing protein [Olivibacter sp. SDN3]QNL51090.1 AraC family transcriptional regulator [Olivibacter sp. SDN3]
MPIRFFKHIDPIHFEDAMKTSVPENLQDFVEGIYVFKAQSIHGRQLLFNDGYPVVVITWDGEKQNQIDIDGERKIFEAMWACGGVLKNIYWELYGHQEDIFIVRFYPYTFYKLFGIQENYLEHRQVINFSEIAGANFNTFLENYYTSAPEKKIETFSRFISAKISHYSYPGILIEMLGHIDQRKGLITVKELLETHGVRLNYKWLERNFKKHLGFSPQRYIMLRRFLNAYLDLDRSPSKDLLQVAIDNGYCDENHFIKDFRQYSGMPPKTYFQTVK